MSVPLGPNEQAQLMQTIEMFEVITQSQPLDHQSLEILKEAYFKLGRQPDVVNTSKRIAQAYVQEGQLSSAILEYESILQLFPDDPDVQTALTEIESRANSFSGQQDAPEPEFAEKPRFQPAPVVAPSDRSVPVDVDDGRLVMSKLFVDSRLISAEDFASHWFTPSLIEPPPQVIDPFIQVLAEKGLVPIEQSLKLICEKSRLGYLPLDRYDIDIETARSFPREVCRRWCVLPFDRLSTSVMVCTANPFNKQAVRDLEQVTKHRLLWYLSTPSELIQNLKKVFR
jgi:hypothetical protein